MFHRFKVPQINEIYGATEGNANISEYTTLSVIKQLSFVYKQFLID